MRPRCQEQGEDKRTEIEEIAKDNERCEPTVRPYASVPLVNCSAVSPLPARFRCGCDFDRLDLDSVFINTILFLCKELIDLSLQNPCAR